MSAAYFWLVFVQFRAKNGSVNEREKGNGERKRKKIFLKKRNIACGRQNT